MALRGTSGTLVIFLLGVALTAKQLQAQFTDVAQTEEFKTQQHNEDEIDVIQSIVGGTQTVASEFPWQLFVKIEKEAGTYLCGGSIISDTWSMSAAHCFASANPDEEEGFIVTAKKIYLYAGATNKYSVHSDPDVQSNIIDEDEFENHVFIHPDYKRGATYNNDIAILKCKEPWSLTVKVSPIALANADDFIVGKQLIVSGWGKTCASCSSSSILLYVAGLHLISRDECTDYWQSSRITENMICHKTENANTCGGDSGGPVITGSGNSTGPPYVQIGIVSWGSRNCGSYVPKVFVDVAKFRNWINETISDSDSENCEDSSSKCTQWAANGKCSKGKVFAKCRSSCLCGVRSNPTCRNTKNKCNKWATQGKCSQAVVYKKCRSSCRCV